MRAFSIALMAALAIAGCGVGQPGQGGWRAAAEQLDARLDEAKADRGKVPLLANPADAPLLHAVFDLDGIWALDGKDFPTISARCDPVRTIGRSYYLLGIAPNPDGSLTDAERAVARGNSLKYHDELALGAAALLLCDAREGQAVGRFAAALPASERTPLRREAAIGARQRLTNMLTHYIGMQSTARDYASDANRRLLLDTLARAAPVLADNVTIDQRATVRAAIDRELPRLSERDGATLAGIRRAFQSSSCTGDCAY